jgi:hypothetical protein
MVATTHQGIKEVTVGAAAVPLVNAGFEDLDAGANAVFVYPTDAAGPPSADADYNFFTNKDADGDALGWRSFTFEFIGARTAERTYTFPDSEIRKRIYNNSSGGFDVVIRAVTLGETVDVPVGEFRDIQIVENGGVWDVKNYSTTGTGGSGAANKFIASLGGGQREFLAQYDLAGVTQTGAAPQLISDLAAFASDVEAVVLVFQNIIVSDNAAVLQARVSSGAAVKVADYQTGQSFTSSGTDGVNDVSTYIILDGIGNAAGEALAWAELTLYNPSDTVSYKQVWGKSLGRADVEMQLSEIVSAWEGGLGAIDGLEIAISAGSIVSGTVTVFKENISKGSDVSTGGVWQLVDSFAAVVTNTELDIDSSSSGAIDFSEPDTEWRFEWRNLVCNGTPEELSVRVKTSGGYITSGDYQYAKASHASTDAAANAGSNTATAVRLSGSNGITAADAGQGWVTVKDLEKTDSYKHFSGISTSRVDPTVSLNSIGGSYDGDTDAITGIRFLLESGEDLLSLEISVFRRSLIFPSVIPVGGAMTVAQVVEVSAASEIVVDREVDANGDSYLLEWLGTTSADSALEIDFSTDGGSSWVVTNYNRSSQLTPFSGGASVDDGSTGAIAILTVGTGGAGLEQYFRLNIHNPADAAAETYCEGQGVTQDNIYNFGGRQTVAAAHNAFRIKPASGTITGKLILYKLRNHERAGESNPSVMSNRLGTAKVATNPDGTLDFFAGDAIAFNVDGSQNVTFVGNVTMANLTSTGVNDDATGERLKVEDTVLTLGTTSADYTIAKPDNLGATILLGGDTVANGAYIKLFGDGSGGADDIWLAAGNAIKLAWDHSQSRWEFQDTNIVDVGNLTLSIGGRMAQNLATEDAPYINYVATEDADTTSALSSLQTFSGTTTAVQVDVNGVKHWFRAWPTISA